MRNINRDFIEVATLIHQTAAENKVFTAEASQVTTEQVSAINEMIESKNLQGIGVSYYGGQTRIVFKAMGHDDNGDLMLLEVSWEHLQKNRLDMILWMQFRWELSNLLNESNIETYSDGNYIRVNVENSSQLQLALEIVMQEVTFSAKWLAKGLESFNRTYAEYKNHYERNSVLEGRRVAGQGLAAKISDRKDQTFDTSAWMAVETEIQKYQAKVGNNVVSRTWGWEVEAPNPGGNIRVPMGVESGSDGSVESYESDHDDCDCSCRNCTYHECSCENCSDFNDSPEHCGDDECNNAVSYEFRTTGGVTRSRHPGLRALLEQIKDTEKNETAGTHIHVYARDLTAKQIGTVLGAYAITQRIWDVICGRNITDDDRCKIYADHIPVEAISATLRTDTLYHVGKFTAINTHHAANDRGTLEFRQMNCNFDYDRISFMAWMARGLIQTVKNGAQVHEFFAIENITDFIALYEKYGFTFREETQEVEDPYGSRYRQVPKAFQVA